MGIRLRRKKRRNIKLSLAYKLKNILPLSSRQKLKLFLDLSWIFSRLAHEEFIKTGLKISRNDNSDFLTSFIQSESKILDIGCGSGNVIERMLKKTDDIVGVDYDLTSLKVAESKFIGKNIKLIHADVFDYLKSIPRGSFDYIILSHVLEHIENPTEFLRKLTGMSNFIYVEVPDFDSNYLNHYRSLIMTDLIYSDADHVNEFDREELCSIINSAEFSIIKAEYRGGVMKLWCKNN